MTTVYLVQNSSDDGGAVEGVFSTSQKAKDWIKKRPAGRCGDWDVWPIEIDMPPEKDEEKIIANLVAKGHFFVYDPHHRCMHCGLLIGPLQELEDKALISDHKMIAPRCQPIKSYDTTAR
jgi:hypothetical protein